MWEILLRDKKAFAKYVLACSLFVTEMLLLNYVIARIAGVAQTKDINDLLSGAVIGFAALVYSVSIFIISRFMRLKFMRDTILHIRERAFSNILNKNYRQFGKKLRSEYVSNMVNDINVFESQFFLALVNIINSLLVYAASSVILIILDPLLGIVMFAVSWVVFGYNHLFQKKTVQIQEKVQKFNEKFTVEISNTFSGLEILKLNRIEDKFLKKSLNEIGRLERKKYHFFVFTFWQGKSLEFFGTVFLVLLIYYITGLFSQGFSLTRIMLIIQLSNTVIWPVTQLAPLLNTVKSNDKIMKNILDDKTEEPPADSAGDDNVIPFGFTKDITMDNLSFNHDSKMIFSRISLRLEKGRKYLIRGASGAGKTTLINLLSKTYEDYSGQILFDGIPLSKIEESSFNSGTAFIYQDVFLFEDTLKENISLYKDYSDEEVLIAAKKAGLDNLISKSSNGIYMNIDENGKNLSGGERQRISIARAMIRNPDILFADEITSALDEGLGRKIERTLLELDTTVISISHKFYPGISENYDAVIEILAGKARVISMEKYIEKMGNMLEVKDKKEDEKNQIT